MRHPRFSPLQEVDGKLYDARKAPSVAHVVDSALRIAGAAERGEVEPQAARAAVAALELAHDALVGERDYVDKKRWAWEAWQRTQGQQGTARENSGPAPGESSPEGDTGPAPPPWMQPRTTN